MNFPTGRVRIVDRQALAYVGMLLVLFAAGSACARECEPADAADGVVHAELGERLDRHVRGDTKLAFSGNVLVAQGGKVVLHRGYGWADQRNCRAVTNETAFWIGSLSKQFAAAAILKLHQQGKLKLDDPLGRHLAHLPADKQPITVHQLLTHTSGLPHVYAADGVSDRTAAVRALTRAPLETEPGTTFAYSSDGYSLLAILVAAASGESYDAYLREQLFGPAQLHHTTTSGVRRRGLVVAERGPGANRRGDPQSWKRNWGFRGATGVITTSGDLHRWYRALLSGAVLDDADLKRLFRPHVLKREGLHYAYGWQVADTQHGTLIVHSGDDTMIGHDATLRHYVDKDLIVIVTANAGYLEGIGIGQLLGRELAQVALEQR